MEFKRSRVRYFRLGRSSVDLFFSWVAQSTIGPAVEIVGFNGELDEGRRTECGGSALLDRKGTHLDRVGRFLVLDGRGWIW